MITTIAVISTPLYLTSNGADLALDMISNNIYIKRSKITNDLVMILPVFLKHLKTHPHRD